VGVTVTMYVLAVSFDEAVVAVLADPAVPLQAVRNPVKEIAKAKRTSGIACLRQKARGIAIRTAQNSAAPMPSHGAVGLWFAACASAVIVNLDVPVLPGAKVTELAAAVMFAAAPSVELTVVANETVPA